jgi:hypothetical protein
MESDGLRSRLGAFTFGTKLLATSELLQSGLPTRDRINSLKQSYESNCVADQHARQEEHCHAKRGNNRESGEHVQGNQDQSERRADCREFALSSDPSNRYLRQVMASISTWSRGGWLPL